MPMPKPKFKEPSEADVIFSRASLALARSQDIIKSWLPPPAAAAQGGGNGRGLDGDDEEGEEGEEEEWGRAEEPET